MFKPLLRTLPTLSGNYTIGCKVKEYTKLDSNNYEVYIREASLVPLQNNLFNKDIELNLVKDQHEYVITKYFRSYSNVFYKDNYQYDKNNYREYDEYEINRTNDSRNKDYEFGCKRLYYSQNNYQFSFYAPFYIDDIKDLPEYFVITIELSKNFKKTIKININKDDIRNYLKSYLKNYIKKLNNKVIFCSPESKQATYFGIDVHSGGFVKYIDNVIGDLYNNQNTINNFDYTICKGFERNNLVMSQIIPLSFMFNINDMFNEIEYKFFNTHEIKIYGFYYNKFGVKINFYDFSINYYNYYHKYLKYDELSGKYTLNHKYLDNGEKLNIMNVNYPSLNEGRFTKYRFTNKITPDYCRFKLLYSDDDNPYITNLSYGYSYIQNPNFKYGAFPTMFKDITPVCIVKENSLILPTGNNIKKYYSVSNFDKYKMLMSNFYSSWFNVLYLNENIFNKDNYWCDIINKHAYFNGVLYKLTNDVDDSINKFGVFINLSLNVVDNYTAANDITSVKYILSKNKIDNKTTIKMKNISYNDTYLKENLLGKYDIVSELIYDTNLHYDDKFSDYYYDFSIYSNNDNSKTRIFHVKNLFDHILNAYNSRLWENSIDHDSYTLVSINDAKLTYNTNIYTENTNISNYLTYNKKLVKNTNGSYIIEDNYYNKNKYYKFDDIINILDNVYKLIYNYEDTDGYVVTDEINIIVNKLKTELDKVKIIGYELLPIYNNANIYKKYINNNTTFYKLIFDNEEFKNIYDQLYIEAQFLKERTKLTDAYDILNENIDKNNNFKIYIRNYFISEQTLFTVLQNNEYIDKNDINSVNNTDATVIRNIYSSTWGYNITNSIESFNKYYMNIFNESNKNKLIEDLKNILSTINSEDINISFEDLSLNELNNTIDKCNEYLFELKDTLYYSVKDKTYKYKKYNTNINKYEWVNIDINSDNFNYTYVHDNMNNKFINIQYEHIIMHNLISIYLSLFDDINKNGSDINTLFVNISFNLVNNHFMYYDLMMNAINIIGLRPFEFQRSNSNYVMPFSHYIYNLIQNLLSYSFYPYNFDKNIISYNYFKKNTELYDDYIYVDPYNLNEYIYKYNIRYPDKNIPYIDKGSIYKFKNFFYRIINVNHMKEYAKELHNYSDYGILYRNKLINYSANIIDHIYIKNRIYVKNTTTNNIEIKDKYTLLSKFLFNNYKDKKYVDYLYKLTNPWVTEIDSEEYINDIKVYKNANQLFFNYMCSESRNLNDKFIINLDDETTIELDLTLNKYFIQLNDSLTELLEDDETYLYLYKCNKYSDNNDNWDIYIEDNIIDEPDYEHKDVDPIVDISRFLTPLFNNIYTNESDSNNIKNLIKYNKIQNNRYIDSNEIYAKEIDVKTYVRSYIEKNNLQNIIDESLIELNIENGTIEDIENNNEYYRNIFIKEKLGIILYDIYQSNEVSLDNKLESIFSKDFINKYNVTYDNESNLYFASDDYNKYAFYVLDFKFDNTNNSFNINNTYDVSTSFDKINDINISDNIINEYFKIINPFLKTNIFRFFTNLKSDNIVKPNELNVYINYISSKITSDEEYKYISLKNSDEDILYDNIIKYQKNKKLKMIRYFNFITPLIEQKSILNDIWENLFITNDNSSNKYNILRKTNIDINEYHPIHLCTKYDYINNKEISYEDIYQFEYKHFNDNKFYNLKEEIIINIDEEVTYEDLVNIYETEEKTIDVFTKYINKSLKKKLNTNIILFLYNKYNVNYITESIKLNSVKNSKLYKISYKFNLK